LHGLRSIAQQDHEALVAVLPCDHHYLDEPAFTAALECAFSIAAEHTNSVVLLGAPPQSPEVDYGWIELGPSIGGSGGPGRRVPGPDEKPSFHPAFRVRGFFEKPLLRTAGKLLARGALWNTFVTVGHVGAFLEIMNVALSTFAKFLRTDQLWSGSEVHIPDSLYENLRSVDFSRDVLSVQAQRLVVSRMGETGWSDLGQPKRVLAAIRNAGLAPWWTKKLSRHRMAEDGSCPSFARFPSS
jgi:mannose-1-phosphate guanylyltransferase